MTIPKLHYISEGISPKIHLENIQKACTAGAELVVLDIAINSEKKLLKLAQEAREITAHFQTRLIISEHYKIAKAVKADGVHFKNAASFTKTVREYLYTWQMVGATANTIQHCKNLIANEVDYIYLGPFKILADTNNSTTNLGLNGYTLICEALTTETPIIGFEGITLNDVTAILETGVSGIAVATTITNNFNTINAFNKLLNASSTQEQRYTFE